LLIIVEAQEAAEFSKMVWDLLFS